MDLFKKAIEWYTKAGDYRKAAIELFPEEKLKEELENYKKEVRKQRMQEREKELEEVLEICKKRFPIGTLIRSDDGTDHLPNLVISEPYISETKYHFPHNKHSWEYDKTETVLVNTVRIHMNEPLNRKEKVGLETVLYYDGLTDNYHKDAIINLKNYEKERIDKKNEHLKWLKDKRDRCQEELNAILSEIKEYEEYNPSELTEEKLKEILENVKKSN